MGSFGVYIAIAIGLNLVTGFIPAAMLPCDTAQAAVWGVAFTHYCMDARIWHVRSDKELAAALRMAWSRVRAIVEACTLFFFDMGRVLYNSEEPIQGAAETLAWLRAAPGPASVRDQHHLAQPRDAHGKAGAIWNSSKFCTDILTPCARAAADGLRPEATEAWRYFCARQHGRRSTGWNVWAITQKAARVTW